MPEQIDLRSRLGDAVEAVDPGARYDTDVHKALDIVARVMEPELDRLASERSRFRIAWLHARTRARSTACGADMYARRRAELQRALADTVGELLIRQLERDEARIEVTRLSRGWQKVRAALISRQAAGAVLDLMDREQEPGEDPDPKRAERDLKELRDHWREVRRALIAGVPSEGVLDLMDRRDRDYTFALAEERARADAARTCEGN
jgi:hypothetical protein